MKITKSKLKQIIREELSRMINERKSGSKYTHPNYPGVTFIEYVDDKSGYPEYVGVDEEGNKTGDVINPFFGKGKKEYKELVMSDPGPQPEKFTHPDYPGIIFTKGQDPKSGYPTYRGEDPDSPYGIFVDDPRKTKQMVPVK